MVKSRTRPRRLRRTRATGIVLEGVQEREHCRIVIFGIGGAGNDMVNRLMETRVAGAKCIAVNTDLPQLNAARATEKILIGERATRGLGAGGDPSLGRAAIEESKQMIAGFLNDVDVVFIAVGLGGGTGSGAAPVVAEMARRRGAIAVGVVTTPLRIEKERVAYAAFALNEMRRTCDTVVVIDNNKLMELFPNLPINEAFKVADQVSANTIQGIVETISAPSLINLDLAGFETIVRKGGVAVVGVGESDAPNRAEEAVRNALRSPLLDADCVGARGALVHVSGDDHMTIEEANRVGEIVTEKMGHNALVVWGAKANRSTEGFLKVTLVMTGVHPPKTLNGFGTIMPKLYDIESSYSEPEKEFPVDLNLDQIEDFEE